MYVVVDELIFTVRSPYYYSVDAVGEASKVAKD